MDKKIRRRPISGALRRIMRFDPQKSEGGTVCKCSVLDSIDAMAPCACMLARDRQAQTGAVGTQIPA